MSEWEAAAALLPGTMRRAADCLSGPEKARCEELRLRCGYPLMARLEGRERALGDAPVTEAELRAVLETATRSSFHAAQSALSRGYITAPGGVRVGVCGTAVMSGTDTTGLRAISSLSLRIPRAVTGCADGIWNGITAGGFSSLLILAPPGGGKTTLLREIIRRLSESGYVVSVADERSEIGGDGRFDLGPHTDVMTGAPKALAAGMLLRAMNPAVIAMDEITDPADAQALLHAVGCGVYLLATIHAADMEDVRRRPNGRMLLEAGAFSRYVTVENWHGIRHYRAGTLT
ncbi:MAG: ATPase, T2SS/T4P/T4SS family [Oscillospiraceae bacterium]